ncbi:MAG: tRNA pseudouridine32 synthase/23S rRNA pseudouridine746 synthase [Oceanospirillaceae bacterium]|jgi:tRNA pseudouridine32 synthase/23S rRNA pseudouridine746 synthase
MPEFHAQVIDPSIPAAELLKQQSSLSKQQIKQAMKKGAVWISDADSSHKRLRRVDKILKIGQQLHLYYDAQILGLQVDAAVLIADEGDYSVWYKPYGMLSQGSKWGDHCTINRWVEQNHPPQRPAFIVNRLDRAAQGLMLIAHTKSAASALSGLFERRAINKKYTALVSGSFPKELILDTAIDEKHALSKASLLAYESNTNKSLVCIEIETGRKHQIRKHLSGAGFPIIGDRLYGPDVDESSVNLCLVSTYLAFNCPITGLDKSYRLKDDYLPKVG